MAGRGGKTHYKQKLKKESIAKAKQHKENEATGNHWSQIKYQIHPSEFEIHAFVYWKLTEKGYRVRGDVPASTRSKFDLVVFDENEQPVRIIEVKKQSESTILRIASSGSPTGINNLQSLRRQIRKYLSYQLPVDLVCGMESAMSYVEEFSLESPSRIPSKLVPEEKWDGVVTAEDWLADKGNQSKAYDRILSMIAQSFPPGSGMRIEKVSFQPELCACFTRLLNRHDETMCLIEINHGSQSEPDSLKQKRIEFGRNLAKEQKTYLVRADGYQSAKSMCKAFHRRKRPWHKESHWSDRVSVKNLREIPIKERSQEKYPKQNEVDVEFRQLVEAM